MKHKPTRSQWPYLISICLLLAGIWGGFYFYSSFEHTWAAWPIIFTATFVFALGIGCFTLPLNDDDRSALWGFLFGVALLATMIIAGIAMARAIGGAS